MSLFNSFDRAQHFAELGVPLETQGSGVMTPAQRRTAAQGNIFGSAFKSDVLLSPMQASAAAGDIFTEVPNVASGGTLAAHVTDAMSHSIRIRSANGTKYYIMATTTVTNRTGGA